MGNYGSWWKVILHFRTALVNVPTHYVLLFSLLKLMFLGN